MRKLFTVIGLLLLCAMRSAAQQYPVQVTPQLIPPYTLQISEYYSPTVAGAEKLRVMLLNRDLQRPQLTVRLRMVIEGQSLRIRTRDDVTYASITLQSGVPYYVSPAELAQYFNPDNLEFSGFSRQQYEQTGKLPEGFYSFCIDAVEIQSNQSVSNKGCAFAWMTLNEPPFLNLPAKAEALTPHNPQNIIFNWTPRHTSSPTAAFNIDYTFSIIELTDNGLSPEAAFTNNPPLFKDSTAATTYLYDVTKPQLIPGKKYAWRVQAKAKSGVEDLAMFRNQGYSETWWFTYQNTCTVPIGISATPQGQRVTIQWQQNIQHLDYKVEYREKNNPDAVWFTMSNTLPRVVLTDLKPAQQYEYRVGGACQTDVFNYSDLLTFTTNGSTVNNIPNCGDSSQIPGTLPQNLMTGVPGPDTIKAGDFKVIPTQLTPSGNTYSGQGYVTIPWLFNLKVAVRITNASINTDKKLVGGVVETTYDPTESGIGDIDEFLDAYMGGRGVGGVQTGLDTTDYKIDFVIPMPGGITTTLGAGYNSTTGKGPVTITVSPSGGGPSTTFTTDHLPATIKDGGGNIYQVNKDGTVTSVGQGGGKQLLDKTNKSHIDTDKATVVFVNYPEKQIYAFDEWNQVYAKNGGFNKEYERLNDDYHVSAKAIAQGKTDYLKAVVTIKDTSINADSIRFVNGKGTIYTRTKLSTGVYEILVVGGPEKDAQEIYALYQKSAGKTLNLGKVLVASYPHKEYTVKLVPVNGATVNADSIKNALNKVYNPLNVSFDVKVEQVAYTDMTWDLNSDGKMAVNSSSMLTVYSNEMKKLIANYRDNRSIDLNMSYIFVLNAASDNTVYGEMPRSKRFGFIFTGSNPPSPGKLVSHEVGHGLFALKHTFEEGFATSDLADNLLNYNQNQGTTLVKHQWDFIHDPALVIGLFEDDDDARYVRVGISELDTFRNVAPGKTWDGTYTFMASSGRAITLPKDITDVTFDTADPFYAKDGTNFGFSGPIGGLNGFWRKDKYYYASAINREFQSYKTASNEIYIDTFTAAMKPEKAVIAFGWFDGTGVGFDLYWLNIPGAQSLVYETNYTAKGFVPLDAFSVVDIIHPMATDNNSYEFYGSTASMIDNWNNGVKGQSLKTFKSSYLSPLSIEYLNQNQEYTKRGSLYAPVLIANAYWITSSEANENVISCQMQASIDNANFLLQKALLDYQNRNPYAEMEAWKPQQYRFNEDILKFQNELEREYRKFRLEINALKTITPQANDINYKISVTTSGDSVKKYLGGVDKCMMEKLSIDNRIKAIDLLETIDEEDMIIKLIESIKYNGQQSLLMNKVFSNNSALFFKLWNSIDGRDFVEYIKFFKTLAQGLALDNPPVVTKTFSFVTDVGDDYDYEMDKAANLIKMVYIHRSYNGGSSMITRTVAATFRPDEFVKLSLQGNSSYITYDESSGVTTMDVPAFYLPYLVWCKKQSDKAFAFKAVRVLADVVGIVLAIPSGGASLTVAGGISLAISSVDIVIALSEDELQKSALGQGILEMWTYLQWADLAAAGVNGIQKLTTTAGRLEFKITMQTFLQNIRDNITDVLKPVAALRTTLFKMQRMGLDFMSAILRQKILTQIDELLLQKQFIKTMVGAEVKIKNLIECTVQFESKEFKLFNIESSSSGVFGKDISYGTIQGGDELVGHVASLKQIDAATGQMIYSNVFVYYRRSANQIILAKAFGQVDNVLLSQLALLDRAGCAAFVQNNLQHLTANTNTIWAMENATMRGNIFEELRFATDRSAANGWEHVGALRGGTEPLVDFYQASNGIFVQQKATSVTLDASVTSTIRDYKTVIDKLADAKSANNGVWKLSDGRQITITDARLEIVVPQHYPQELLSSLQNYNSSVQVIFIVK